MNNVSIKLSEHFSLRELTKNKCENGRWEHSFARTGNLKRLCGWLEMLRSEANGESKGSEAGADVRF